MKKGIIDAHVHIFSPDVEKNRGMYNTDDNFKILYHEDKGKIACVNDLYNHMERNNITQSISLGFPWIDPYFCSKENEYILSCAHSSENRIIPFGTVPLKEKKIGKYIETMKADGFAGVGELAFYTTGFSKESELFLTEVFEVCTGLDMCVCLHVNEPVGHQYVGKYTTDFSFLAELIAKKPALRVMLSHWGGGIFIYELMPEIQKAFSHVWYDSAASMYLYNDKILSEMNAICGSHKAVFGSDFPLIDAERYFKSFNPAENEGFYQNNVSAFLGEKNMKTYSIT